MVASAWLCWGCGVGRCGRVVLGIVVVRGLALLCRVAVVKFGSFSSASPESSACETTFNFGVVFCLVLLSAASCCFWSR